MRVVLLTNFIPPYRLPVLREMGSRVGDLSVLVSTEMEGNRSWKTDWDGLDVIVQRTLTFRKNWRHPSGFSETAYVHVPYNTIPLLFKLRPQVVLTGEFGLRTVQAVTYGFLARRCRIIVWATLSEKSELGRGRLRGILRRWIVRHVDGLLVNGASGARYLTAIGADPRLITTIGQSSQVEVANQEPLVRPSRPRQLLYVGQLIPRKGLVQFLSYLDPETAEGIELTVVGEGPEASNVRRLCDSLGIHVTMHGHLQPSEIGDHYARADILLMPTLVDEWGLVVNEALHLGVPVLGSTGSQAVEELIQDRVNGWTFDIVDAESVRRAVSKALATDDQEIVTMSHACRDSVAHLLPKEFGRRLADLAKEHRTSL